VRNCSEEGEYKRERKEGKEYRYKYKYTRAERSIQGRERERK